MRRINCQPQTCECCGESYTRKRQPDNRLEDAQAFKRRRFCSAECTYAYRVGDNHPNWRGGIRHGHSDGYLRNTAGEYLHRVAMARHLGRELTSDEHVHHINGDVTDNRAANLELHTNSEHRKMHCVEQRRDNTGRFTCES